MSERIQKYCKRCGSTDIVTDADANWDIELQRWVLDDQPSENNNFCRDCGGECSILSQPQPPSVRSEWRMACPSCGDDDGLKVAVRAWAALLPQGTEIYGDHEWDALSDCICACGWEGSTNQASIDQQPDFVFDPAKNLAAMEKLMTRREIVAAAEKLAKLSAKQAGRVVPIHDESGVQDGATVEPGDMLLATSGDPELRFEALRPYLWWNAGEIGPAIITGERLSQIVDELDAGPRKDLPEGLDIQGFWIGFTGNAATVVIDIWRAGARHLLTISGPGEPINTETAKR